MKKAAPLFVLLMSVMVLAACGGGDDNETTAATTSGGGANGGGAAAPAGGGGGGGGSTVKVSADPSGALEFDTTKLTAKPGSDTFTFTNESPIGHDFTIESSSGQEVAATPVFTGGTKSVTATLKPGTYKFLCTVPGHAAGGMEGTLTVK